MIISYLQGLKKDTLYTLTATEQFYSVSHDVLQSYTVTL